MNTLGARGLTRRTSHEVRGLKCYELVINCERCESHLTRGAWIEIYTTDKVIIRNGGRTSHEVRGLKYNKSGRRSE